MFSKLRSFVAPKEFYMRVLFLAIPIMLQQGITNTVSLIDTVMVSSIGDSQLAGVTIVGQLFFVFGALMIGTNAGASIYLVQFLGAKDIKRMKESFAVKIIFSLIISVIALLVFSLFGRVLISQFLESPLAIEYGMDYLKIMLYTIIPFALINVYATTYRENKHTYTPMIIGLIAVGVNCFFNWLLIYGHWGFPALGVEGAALGTLISRLVEMVLLMGVAHIKKYPFAVKIIESFHISIFVFKGIIKKTLPLLLNELMWSLGMTALTYAYSQYGDTVVNAFSISNTVNNLFFIIFGGLATSISIIIGEELGANRIQGVKLTAARLITFGVVICIGFGSILAITAPFTPKLFTEINPTSQQLATQFMLVAACFLWVYAYNASCFFILRAGGSAFTAFIFDSLYTWIIPVPVALYCVFVLKDGKPDIIVLYIIVQLLDFIKLILGTYMVHQGKWIRNLTGQEVENEYENIEI